MASRDELRAAYIQGCQDTHVAIQNDRKLALIPVEYAEFGEAGDDYAAFALTAQQEHVTP